jgi:hypothetical protein
MLIDRRTLTLSLLIMGLGLCACSTPRTIHSKGPLQLELGPGATARALTVLSFDDGRFPEQRRRRSLPDGEMYGDEDFIVPPLRALLQEMEASLADQFDAKGLQQRLRAARVTLIRADLSWRIATEQNTPRAAGVPPGIAAVDALAHTAFGGKAYLLCAVEVDIDGRRYSGARTQVLSGDPPPFNHTYVAYFKQAVGDIVKRYAASGAS